MNVNTEDITVAWGQAPHQLDQQFGRWRLAIFQDVQESIDMSKLYFLYDPITEDEAGNGRKGQQGLVIFDTNIKCFAHEIPLQQVTGRVKFLFGLKCPSDQGGSAFVLVSQFQNYGQIQLHFYRLDLSQDGLYVSNCRPLTNAPLNIGGEFIVSMREDAPEVVVLANPGLQVWQIDAMATSPQSPMNNFTVPGSDLTHFYDGFLNNGRVYLLSASPDGHLDYSRVHVLHLSSQGTINTHNCRPDPSRGFPPARKQAAIDSVPGYILVAGGELVDSYNVHRLSDYWVLDCAQFQWTQVPAQMPCPLIEPRLTACSSGNVYLWGDFDQPLPGMPPGTHLRILKISGFAAYKTPPPSYDQSLSHANPYDSKGSSSYPNASSQPPYPDNSSANVYPSVTTPSGYNQAPNSYNPNSTPQPYQQNPPSYPSYNPQQGPTPGYSSSNDPGYPQQQSTPAYSGGGGYVEPGPADPSGTHAYYPPKKDKKKCNVQ